MTDTTAETGTGHQSADHERPAEPTIKDYRPKQVTRILSADGKVVGELFEERRTAGSGGTPLCAFRPRVWAVRPVPGTGRSGAPRGRHW